MIERMIDNTETPAREIAIRYDKTEVLYAREFLASSSPEELMLDFSSGLISDSNARQTKSLPIHTRLALPWSAVERLANVLNQVLENRGELMRQNRSRTTAIPPTATIPQASLPRMSGEQRS